MKKSAIVPSIILVALFSSCNNSPSSPDIEKDIKATSTDVSQNEMKELNAEMNYDDVVASIDMRRESIEDKIASITPKEISTERLREQIKQKWSKIHYYLENGQVIRVKTYPYDSISKRTEEFYFENGKLALAVIEDEGDGATKGREKSEMSKLYYYQDGKLIYEVNNTVEGEYTIRESDGERLQEEANEYLKILTEHQK